MVPQVVEQEIPREVERPLVMMVNRNQDTDQVVSQVRRGNLLGENNLAIIFKRIMSQNGHVESKLHISSIRVCVAN